MYVDEKEKSQGWAQLERTVMSQHDLIVMSCVFKMIEKHGLEGAKAVFNVEQKKRELWEAYQIKVDLCTKYDE